MPNCLKCGSGEALWTFINRENSSESYCDSCYKKYNLEEYKKELEAFHKKKEKEAMKAMSSGLLEGSDFIEKLPPIGSKHLRTDFVPLEEDSGAGVTLIQEAVQFMNKKDYSNAFPKIEKALLEKLPLTYEAYAHKVLGAIYIEKGNLKFAVKELLKCLETEKRTSGAVWEAATHLSIIYSEAGRRDEYNALRFLASRANTRNLSFSMEADNRIRELVRKSVIEQPREEACPKKLSEIQRGGFNEPYCSDSCYSKAGGEIASIVLHGKQGVCGFCQKPVIPRFGDGNIIFPYRNKMLYICKSCISRGKEFTVNIKECCMCGKEFISETNSVETFISSHSEKIFRAKNISQPENTYTKQRGDQKLFLKIFFVLIIVFIKFSIPHSL
ncbi:MAG: hypothetical protein HY754_00225 [Nitrospirae bacterium]|nr:hypothetical protein [Nitrospirota bacterium]